MLKLKQPEEMPCGLNVGYDICSTQAKIFSLIPDMGFDDDDFIEKYMNSKFCNREMDSVYSHFHMADPEDCLDDMLEEKITIKKSDMHYDPDAIEWVGWMYRYLQLRFEMPSRELYGRLPLQRMLIHYLAMHNEDVEYFVEDVNEELFGR